MSSDPVESSGCELIGERSSDNSRDVAVGGDDSQTGECNGGLRYVCKRNKSSLAIILMLLVTLSINALQLDFFESGVIKDPFVFNRGPPAAFTSVNIDDLLTNNTCRLCPKQFRLDSDIMVSVCKDPEKNNKTIVDIRRFVGNNSTIVGISMNAESMSTLNDILTYVLDKFVWGDI